MSIETSANPVGIQDQTTVPQIRTFQTLDSSIGRVAENVNLFRGNVTFPLTLLSLKNRGGLQADVVLNYQSDIERDVTIWNLECPTSTVGLGWQLPYEMIELASNNSTSPYDHAYYLSATDGSRSQIFLTSQTDDLWTFEADVFSYSTIHYFPRKQIWHITDTDGLVRIYGADVSAGDSPHALRHAIKWGGVNGNWTGSSTSLGQSLFPISWNLSRVRNQWGDEIVFIYSSFPDDSVQIGGAGGLKFTRASYLRSISDPSGRVVEFGYGDKLYTSKIREYEPPHVNPNPGGPEAYQDRYETRFLDNIKVSQKVGDTAQNLFTIWLDYSVENLAGATTPGDPAYLYKRYLRGLTTVNAAGKILPGLRFDYYRNTDVLPEGAPVHVGALKTVTYPEGGIATYAYSRQPVQGTAHHLVMSSTDPGWVSGIPRFWFGADYLVLTYYDELDSNKLTVKVHDWNGRWLTSTPIVTQLPFSIDLSSLQVLLEEDFIALSCRLVGAGTNGAILTWAVRRAYGRYGTWEAVQLDMPPIMSDGAPYQVVAGRGFIAAAAAGVSTIYRYVWDPRSKQWGRQNLNIPTLSAGEWSLGARNNFFTLCQFQPGMPLALTMYYYDRVTLRWNDDLPPLDNISTYVWQDKLPKLSWSLSDTFATATYIVASDPVANTFDYAARIYLWDRNFQQLPPPPPITGTDIPTNTKEPVFVSLATGSLVGNVGNLLRFDGVDWNSGYLGSFDVGSDVAQFTYGDDLAVGVSSEQGIIGAYSPWTGQFNILATASGSTGAIPPTINYPYVTVVNQIYRQQSDGTIVLLNQQLPLDVSAVANHAPTFLAYGLGDGTSYIWPMKNGVLAPNPTLVQGVIFPPGVNAPGTDLTGPFAFATYVGPSLDQPSQITLHRLLSQTFTGPAHSFVVAAVTVSDGLGGTALASFDYNTPGATGTVSPFGLSTQFAQVKSVLGSATPDIAPFGYSIHKFFDGMNPVSAPPRFLYSLAGGLLREADGYDSAGTQVARTVRSWEIMTSIQDARSGATVPLIGSYVRMSGSTETIYDVNPMSETAQPPLEVPTVLTYNEANGKPRSKQTQYYDNPSHQFITSVESYLFAYEKYPALAEPDLNTLAPSIQTTVTVGGVVTKIEATIWARVNPGSVWAPLRRFQARGANSVLTAANWANTSVPDPAQWQQLWQVTKRDACGEIQEYVATDQLSNSIITDTSQQLVLAAFGNASGVAQQVLFLGFEIYESLEGWTLAGASPSAAIAAGDSSTGSRCLVMAGSGIPQSSPLVRSLNITEPLGRQYILSCWVKTPAGFNTSANLANWVVSGLPAGDATLPIPDTAGKWQYVYLLFDLPASVSPRAITLTLTNTTAQAVKVDDVRLSPALSGFTGTVYDPALRVATATIESTGALNRSLHGDFDETQGDVKSREALTQLRSSYLSRRGNQGEFTATEPNTTVTVQPRGWGFYQSFNLGGVFDGSWTSATPANWETAGGDLVHKAGTADAITFTGFPAADSNTINVFGTSLRAIPQSVLSAAVGLSCGTFRLAWTPATATWSVTDISAQPLVVAPVRSLLDVDYATYSARLNANTLPFEFLVTFPLVGLPLANGSTVATSTAGQAWCIRDAASAIVYYLVRSTADPTKIQVAVFPREWTLVVVGQTLTLFADGGRVLSYAGAGAIARTVSLFATDAVAFNNAVFFTDAEIRVGYVDGDRHVIQEQVAAPTAAQPTSILAKATIYDALGRDVIKTQRATLVPAAGQWGSYRPDVAAFNWATLTISGIVNTQNPGSGGYPYWRTRYEPSPLARKVEIGRPGADYAITSAGGGAHTTRFFYGLNDASIGFDAGKFARKTSMSPDGVTKLELSDQRGSAVASAMLKTRPPAEPSWETTQHIYDAAANLVRSITPMGWSDVFAYDFLGHATSATRANEGVTLSMYDSIGRLRFQMNARGALTPNYIRYWKYDVLSRVVEEGCNLQSWPGTLAQHVDDQTFPPAAPSNRYAYDFAVPPENPPSLLALGKLTQIISANEVAVPSAGRISDSFSSIETLRYDIYRAVVGHRITGLGDELAYDTAYSFNNLGELLTVQYPGSGAPLVAYQIDVLGRVTKVSVNGKACAVYAYDQNSKVVSETMYDDSGVQVGVTRSFSYAPPGWRTKSTGSQFSEQIVYAPTNGAPGFYNGSPSKIITEPRGPNSEFTAAYQYDPQGRVSSVNISDGVTNSFTYDANGNLAAVGAATNTYSMATHDQVQTTLSPPDTLTFGYDAAGDLVSRTSVNAPSNNLTLTWDCFRGTPIDAQTGTAVSGQATINLRYGYRGRRVLKSITAPSATTIKRYLRGAGDDPLVEILSTGSTYRYVYGPLGLVQVRVADTPYFVAKDALGSVRALMDTAAALVGGYDYLPFGALKGPAFGSNPALMRYRFTNRELDETNLYDFRARLYDALQGRFISADPDHQFVSPYLYAANNPLVFTDPSGAFIFALLAAIAEVIADVVVAAVAAIPPAVQTAAAVGAGVGAAIGAVQGAETIVQKNLSGAEAAGAFFGTVILSAVGGALAGGAAAVTGAAITGVTLASARALAAGVIVQGGIAAAQSAGQAALVGDDPGDAAWKNGIAAGASFLVGGLADAGIAKLLQRATFSGTTKLVLRGIASGSAGGLVGGGTTAALNQDAGSVAASDVLQGALFGALTSIYPEIASDRLATTPRQTPPDLGDFELAEYAALRPSGNRGGYGSIVNEEV